MIGYLQHIARAKSALDDVGQSIWAALLVGDAHRPGTLTSYAGVGSLAGYIGISAQRMALRHLRREDLATRTAQRALAESYLVAGDADLDLMRVRHQDEFQRAVREALERLDDRTRLILRMRVLDGLTVARIAKAYQVGQATVSRWLEKARAQIRQEVRHRLREHLSLTTSDFEALVGLMLSQIDLSISSVLGARA